MTFKSRRHALGQHFLRDAAILNKMADAVAPRPEEVIVEIGAGAGALTRVLAPRCRTLVALEKDARLIPGLSEASPANVRVEHADALRFDIRRLAGELGVGSLKLVGNIPYSISTPLLHRVLEERELIAECHLLLQKEVAEKLTAAPGSRKYGPLSVMIQVFYAARVAFRVAPGSFSPPPEVESAFVSLRKRERPLVNLVDAEGFHRFLKQVFAARRRTLCGNLARHAAADVLAAACSSAAVPEKARAEELPVETLFAVFLALKS
jgi:16S rRNA (adenine1518-N6/adenine1519-N6)-dimethyltransferase